MNAVLERVHPSKEQAQQMRDLDRLARRNYLKRLINTTKHDRRVMLKIKLKSLADEARTIRREEVLRLAGELRTELWWHRVHDVRGEARAAHLAYGALRGVAIERMEGNWGWELKEFPATYVTFHIAHVKLRERVIGLMRKYGAKGVAIPAWLTPVP